MGKGKKKGGGKATGLEAGTSALSVADSGDEECGLTGGGRKKKPQKVKSEAEPVVEKKDEKPPEPASAKPDPPKETPEEEECGGLGLTGGKKKNRKKKSAPAAQPGAHSVGEPGAQPVGVQSGPAGSPAGPPPEQARSAFPGAPQAAGWPAPSPTAPGASTWQKSAPQGPPQAQYTQVAPRSAGPPQGQRPPTAQPGASGDKSVKYLPLPMSKQQQKCHYVIPAKILGRSIQSKRIQVTTNYLPMNIKPIKVQRYDFAFNPDKPRKMIPEVYKLIMKKCFPNEMVAFDMFKNAYSLNLFKKDILDITHSVDYPDANGRIMQFKVVIKFTGTVDFSKIIRHMETQGSSLAVPMEEIQCMDVVLRQGSLQNYVKVGRNFFKRPDRPIDLSGGLEMWTGLFQSAIFTSRPFINIDVAHKGFPVHQPMINAFQSMGLDLNRGIEQQPGRNAETFKDFVKGLRVICQLVGGASDGQTREFIVNSIKDRPAALQFSKEKDGGKLITVYDYYLREKGYKIKYPHLPCLWVGARDRSIYYPLELCTVGYGQALRRQLNEFQLATMVREAATPPDERKRKIEEVARHMNYNQNVLFKKFGLEISNQFLEVEAKVLQPPSLSCGEGRATFPSRGAWNSSKLLKPEALVSWGFIGLELQPHACNFDQISSLLTQTGSQLGMQVSQAKVTAFNVTITDLRALFFKAIEKNIRLLFIIVPARGRDYYHKVKQFAENDVGILTQCIREQTATRRMNHQTMKNILLKVNSKLMGINQSLDNSSIPRCIAAGNVMIVGADVTHPSPEQQNIPSIAAVTASMDPKCFVYHIELSIQSPKAEVIQQFEDMMCDHLKMYIQRNGRPPKKIYVFRDGVSEGQFGAVMNQELKGLLNAYARFSKEKPEILFLLVQKRHHTRLFGTDTRTRKVINVEPGTVVDTHIVHPKELDFYLVSHAAIKGTARPTRYHSVCNDGGIPHDEVEQLTFYLCHLYSRCMRSVSYPTPTYYAHLACLRARSLTHGVVFNNADLEQSPRRLRVLDKMLRNSIMFFV